MVAACALWINGEPPYLMDMKAERDFDHVITLFRRGRHWGAIEHHPMLHFETCYYQAIEFAIARGLQVFEGGAQGEHKMARGLLPVATQSAHWLAHPEFTAAVGKYLERETALLDEHGRTLAARNPFKSG